MGKERFSVMHGAPRNADVLSIIVNNSGSSHTFFFFFSQPFSNKKALLICFGAGGAGGVLFHRHFSFLAKWIFQLGHYLTNCATPFTAPSKMMWHKNHPEKIITISRQKQSNPHPRRSSRPKHTFSVGGGLHLASLTWVAVAVGGAEPEK